MQVPGRKAGTARERLRAATLGSIGPAAADWLRAALDAADDPRAVDIAFGSAPRRVDDVPVDAGDGRAPPDPLAGLDPPVRAPEAARMLIALAHAASDPDAPERLLRRADVGESRAIYRALALFPPGTRLDDAVARGLRTHARPVFEAIAHDNPWPAAHLDEHRWNHLVLKALFIESALAPIVGLDARANPTLARMLLDFADERRAAGRKVPVELWRCALPFAPPARLAGHALPPDAAAA